VESVIYCKDGFYTIKVTIKKNFANAATEHSKFFIIDDPHKSGNKAVEIILLQTKGALLKDGATVQGSSDRSVMLEKLAMDIDRGLEYLKREYEDLQGKIGKIPESKEYKELRRELTELTEELKQASKETNERIQKELIPFLKQELERLKEKLRKFREDEQKKPLEIKL